MENLSLKDCNFHRNSGVFYSSHFKRNCSSMVLRTLNKPVTLSRSKINKTKVLRMIFVHLVIFCFCFVPYNINLILYSLMRTQTFVNLLSGNSSKDHVPNHSLHCCFKLLLWPYHLLLHVGHDSKFNKNEKLVHQEKWPRFSWSSRHRKLYST